MFHASEVLDSIEIVYFLPALPLSTWVCCMHGFSREAGWFLLIVLSLVRVIGGATGIAATKAPTNESLIACSLITSSIGSTLLVAVLTGIINRIDTGSGRSPLSPRMRKMIQLAGLAAVILGIVGGTKIADSNAQSRADGMTYIKASVILILVQYLASVAVLSFSAMNMRYIMAGDRRLFFIACASLPFVLIRVIYSMIAAFDYTSSTFSIRSTTTTAVAVRAVLGVAMEIVAVSMYLFGGLTIPRMLQGGGTESGETMDHHKQRHGQARISQVQNAAPVAQRGRY